MSIVCIVTVERDPLTAARDAVDALGVDIGGSPLTVIARRVTPPNPATPTISSAATVIALEDMPASLAERLIARLLPAALVRRLRATPLGRVLLSVLPADDGRLVWRRVRRSPEALRALAAAELVVACDAAAVRTAWFARHRLGAQRAVIAAQG